jgi:hypothetical protein
MPTTSAAISRADPRTGSVAEAGGGIDGNWVDGALVGLDDPDGVDELTDEGSGLVLGAGLAADAQPATSSATRIAATMCENDERIPMSSGGCVAE